MTSLVVAIPDGLHEDAVELLEQNGIKVIPEAESKAMGTERLLREADAIAARGATKVDVLVPGMRVKIFGRVGSGIDNFSKARAQIDKAGIPIVNSPEPNSYSVAELVFAYILHHARNITGISAKAKAGEWAKKQYKSTQLRGKVMGVVGVGKIGAEVAIRANAFGMKVLLYDNFYVNPRAPGMIVDLDNLLKTSDYISIHISGKDKVIGEREIGLMKQSAFLMNTARGGVVDEIALLEALNSGKIAGAALDVFTKEPFDDSIRELLAHPKIIPTPHIGAQTEEGQRDGSIVIAQKFVNYLKYGFLADACNMKIDPSLAEMRGLFHRAGMVMRQYFPNSTGEVTIALDGKLLDVGDEVRTQLENAYLFGLLSGYVNPLSIGSIKGQLQHRVTNVNVKKGDVVLFNTKTPAGEYMLELDYAHGVITGIGTLKEMYKTEIEVTGNVSLFEHDNVRGTLAIITRELAVNDVNIATLTTFPHDGKAMTAAQTYQAVPPEVLDGLVRNSPHVLSHGMPQIYVRQAKQLALPPSEAF